MRRQGEFIRKRGHPEQILQQMLVRWLDAKNILFVASMVGGINLGRRVGGIRKSMGCRAGVHDIIILQPAGGLHGMTLELKVKGGKVTDEQIDFWHKSLNRGYHSMIMPPEFEVPEALTWAIKAIERYLTGKK